MEDSIEVLKWKTEIYKNCTNKSFSLDCNHPLRFSNECDFLGCPKREENKKIIENSQRELGISKKPLLPEDEQFEEEEEQEEEETSKFNLGNDFSNKKFNSFFMEDHWENYLETEFKEMKFGKWITKALAKLILLYYKKGKISLDFPEITVESILSGKHQTESKGTQLFNAIKELKDSKYVSRRTTTRPESLMEMKISYSSIAESTIKLKSKALIILLNFPESFLDFQKEFDEKEREREGGYSNYGSRYGSSNPKIGIIINPKRDLTDIVLSESNKKEIEGFINSITKREKLLLWGITYTPKLILAGVIGTGKSMTAEAIAKTLDMNLYRISSENVIDKYVGATAQNIEEMILYARKNQDKMILFIDELDGLLTKRHFDSGAEMEISRAVNTFLVMLEESNNLIVIGASNHIHQVDKAGLSRFTKIIWFDLPDKLMLIDIIKLHFQNLPINPEISIEKLAEECFELKYSGRDIRNLTIEIAQEMLTSDKDELTPEILQKCMKRLRARSFKDKASEYKRYLEDSDSPIPKELLQLILKEESNGKKEETPKAEIKSSSEIPQIENPIMKPVETNMDDILNQLSEAQKMEETPKKSEEKEEQENQETPPGIQLEINDIISFNYYELKKLGIVKEIKRKWILIQFKDKKGNLRLTEKLKGELELRRKGSSGESEEKLIQLI